MQLQNLYNLLQWIEHLIHRGMLIGDPPRWILLNFVIVWQAEILATFATVCIIRFSSLAYIYCLFREGAERLVAQIVLISWLLSCCHLAYYATFGCTFNFIYYCLNYYIWIRTSIYWCMRLIIRPASHLSPVRTRCIPWKLNIQMEPIRFWQVKLFPSHIIIIVGLIRGLLSFFSPCYYFWTFTGCDITLDSATISPVCLFFA